MEFATMLWQQAEVLAVDEPTNHIDMDARAMLVSALRNYRGIGLLVSHDRDLLDMLGLGIARQPHLILMDEPTNHLDLPSIECLEQALEDCPCGMLLVSHDERFLRCLTSTRWHIAPAASGSPEQMCLQIL